MLIDNGQGENSFMMKKQEVIAKLLQMKTLKMEKLNCGEIITPLVKLPQD